MKIRKLVSKAEEKKKRQRNQFLVGGVMILVMFSSIIGYSLSGLGNTSSTSIKYNGLKFVYTSNYWDVNIGNFKFSFSYNPNQVVKLNSSFNLLDNYSGKPLYIYSKNSGAEAEIYKNLFNQNSIAQRVQYACPAGEICNENIPSKTCDDNFIIIKEGENSSIRQEKNCVFIEGKAEELVKLSDSFLFKITGIQ
jgi:hypothetical protein